MGRVILESNLTTACHAILTHNKEEFIEAEKSQVDFDITKAVSIDTNQWCRSTPTALHEISTTDSQNRLTPIDGIDRHQCPIEEESMFDNAKSNELDTKESTHDQSVDRYTPCIDRHWIRTAPY